MESYEINYHLARNGISLCVLADEISVTKQAVSGVIHGKSNSRRISQAVADAIDRPLEEVFPRYKKEEA